MTDTALCWLHFGDLHVVDAGSEPLEHVRGMVRVANEVFAAGVDFAVLPGDSANDATVPQFELVRDAVAPLRLPLLVIPGDHDAVGRDTTSFLHVLAPGRRYPAAIRFERSTVVLLDIVSNGRGGPDFAVGDADLAALGDMFRAANEAGRAIVLLTHAYPADTPGNGAALASLIAEHGVAFVDMAHTHYNELANDGRTIWAAVRSIGQAEEGPPGFAISALDNGAASWRFRPHDATGPFVLITHPADHRLQTERSTTTGPLRARVWSGTEVASMTADCGDGTPRPLRRTGGDGPCSLWSLDGPVFDPAFDGPAFDRPAFDGRADTLRVRARDIAGGEDADTIRIGGDRPPVRPSPDGSDRHRIEPWPERGIPGGQLGPNRNGRAW